MVLPLVVCRVVLAAVFFVAGLAKLVDRGGTRRALIEFGLPAGATRFGVLLPLAELAVAVGLLIDGSARLAALIALLLLSTFSAAVAAALARGRRPHCQCFGALGSSPVSWRVLGRNGALAAMACMVVAKSRTELGEFDLFAVRGGSAPVAAAGVALLVAAAAWWLVGSPPDARESRAQPRPPGPEGRLPPGSPAPAFELATADGERLSLLDLRRAGKPLLLVFSNPDCGACAALAPTLEHWRREFSDLLTVAVVSRQPTALPARRSEPEQRIRGSALIDEAGAVASAYGAYATPSAVIVHADGTIAGGLALGAAEIEEQVEAHVQALAGARQDSSQRFRAERLEVMARRNGLQLLVDSVQRALENPIPRGRVLRLIAGAAFVGLVFPRAARAQEGCPPGYPTPCTESWCCKEVCASTDCMRPPGLLGLCCAKGEKVCTEAAPGYAVPYCWCCPPEMQCGKLRSPGGECRYPCPEERRCGDHCYDPATQCCRDRDGAPVAKYPIGDLKDCPDRTQRSEPTVNGCGRDGLPPALTRFLDQWGPHFAEACNTHDRCYGTCGSDRARCDRRFKANLEARCHAAFPQPPGRTDDYDPLGVCLARADKYYEFVRGSFGQRAYDKAQRDFCQCCPDVHHPPRRNPEGGIGQLAPPKTLSLHANAAVSMPVRCPGPTACTGTVLLRHFPNSVAAQPPRPDAVQHDRLRNILLGKTNFRVPGGHTSKVTVRLSKRGLRALDAHPHLPALATIRPRLADGTQRSTGDEFVLIRK